jgi:thioredoxin reductase (NADPH)
VCKHLDLYNVFSYAVCGSGFLVLGFLFMRYTFSMINSNTLLDVVILGSGPAGLTAAIYTSRASLKTLVISGALPGGQLTTTTEVENFPGFPEGIYGSELVLRARQQAEKFGTQFIDMDAKTVSGSVDVGFTVTLSSGDLVKAKTLIIATGASARWLGLDSEQKLRGKGVSACATCDGPFFRDKVVGVVGGGDAAMEEAIFLTKYCSHVHVFIRGGEDKMRASKIMQDEAVANSKIQFFFNTSVQEVLGDTVVTGVTLVDNLDQTTQPLELQGLFVAIGHAPATKFLEGFVDLGPKGYLRVTNNTQTTVPGVFAAGDVADYRYRQAITAAGFGCMAALDAEKFLTGGASSKTH